MGHFLAAKYYKWRIQSIVLWVFGGVMKTDESANRPIKEDVIVTVLGPIQHLFIYFFLLLMMYGNVLPDTIIETAIQFNWMILLFNLLPIYPLDGGKLLLYGLSSYLPFRRAHRMTILFSMYAAILIILLQIFVLPFTLSALLIILFLLLENKTEWKNHYYVFIRFLLNRFNRPVNLQIEKITIPSTYKLIDAFSLFRRNRTNEVHINDPKKVYFLNEQESLYLYFKQNKINETIGDIIKKEN